MQNLKGFTKKELTALKKFRSRLVIKAIKTSPPIIIAMVGLTGSGKTRVAHELARRFSATIISGDEVRVELRHAGESFEKARQICETLAVEAVNRGASVILDSDHILSERRKELRKTARLAGAKLFFVRTYCGRDVLFGRTTYYYFLNRGALGDDFFAGAKSGFPRPAWIAAAAVKQRELWRRTPHHYRWSSKGGGTWQLKRLKFSVLAEIDTTPGSDWVKQVRQITEKL